LPGIVRILLARLYSPVSLLLWLARRHLVARLVCGLT
jgi:hypothetical protein